MPRGHFQHAIVIGAGMAGLLAARVLSDHFETVSLIERDEIRDEPVSRKGVPQGRHVHVLLPRGLGIIEGQFPGIDEALRVAGACEFDAGRGIAWHHDGDWRANFDSDVRMLAMSRPLLETQVSKRVRALPNVTSRQGARVERLVSDGRAVTGVILNGETIEADLVVDATGRGSALPTWLEHLDRQPPAAEKIPVPLTYSTCMFERRADGPDWNALLITKPGAKRGAFAWAIENGQWLVTMVSLFDEPAPRDVEAFLAFAESLPNTALHETIRDCPPCSEPVRYRFPASQRRRYHKMRDFPQGLIAVGDAISSFNPIYGQGMTVAALEAEILSGALTAAQQAGGLPGDFPQRFFKAADRVVDPAWQAVALEDYRFPELAADRPATVRPVQWYMDRVQRATHRSPAVSEKFYRVMGFDEPPQALLQPRILAEVLFGSDRRPS